MPGRSISGHSRKCPAATLCPNLWLSCPNCPVGYWGSGVVKPFSLCDGAQVTDTWSYQLRERLREYLKIGEELDLGTLKITHGGTFQVVEGGTNKLSYTRLICLQSWRDVTAVPMKYKQEEGRQCTLPSSKKGFAFICCCFNNGPIMLMWLWGKYGFCLLIFLFPICSCVCLPYTVMHSLWGASPGTQLSSVLFCPLPFFFLPTSPSLVPLFWVRAFGFVMLFCGPQGQAYKQILTENTTGDAVGPRAQWASVKIVIFKSFKDTISFLFQNEGLGSTFFFMEIDTLAHFQISYRKTPLLRWQFWVTDCS